MRTRTLLGLDRLRRAGTTVLLASHEDRLLETLCDEVWWLEAGEIAAKGDPLETMTRYRRSVADQIRAWGETIPPRMAPSARRRGGGRAEVLAIETLGANGNSTIVWKSGEYGGACAPRCFHEALSDPVIGMLDPHPDRLRGLWNHYRAGHVKIGPRSAGETVTVVSTLCDLCPQSYTLTLAAQDPTAATMTGSTTRSRSPWRMSAGRRAWPI